MPVHNYLLEPGDAVFHPKYGFGTIRSLTRRDRLHPLRDTTIAETNSNQTEDYYDITLMEGGTLLVPVGQAASVGLRRLSNGIAEVRDSLSSPAQSLPANPRERAAVLRVREQLPEPDALARTIRDMLAQSQGRTLSATEQNWLDKACQRLSAEVALVDHISVSAAKSAVLEVITQTTEILKKTRILNMHD